MKTVSKLRLKSASGTSMKILSSFDSEYPIDPDGSEFLLEDKSSESMSKLEPTPSIDYENDTVDVNKIEYVDIDSENELPDDFLDNCDEKLITENDTITSKQLLHDIWHQNVNNFAKNIHELKKKGANFKVADPVNASGDTFLHEIVRKPGYLSSLQVILESNVLSPNELTQLINAKNYAGNTALHIIASRGIDEYLNILCKKEIDIMSENERGKTALLVAIEMNKKEIVKKLISLNEEILFKKDFHGINAYELSLELNHFEISNLLKPYFSNLKDCIDIDKFQNDLKIKKIKQQFFEFIREENIDGFKCLLKEYPFLLEETNDDGRTPLHVAVLGRNTSLIPQILISEKVNVNSKDNNGNTPLHWAASHHTGYSFGILLIEAGGKVDVANNNGNYPIHMAVFSRNYKLVKYILNRFNCISSGLRKANEDHNTALHIICAVAKNNSELDKMVTLMIEKRAETSSFNSRKETPLHIAASAGCTRIPPSLCDQLHAKDSYGNTPLLSAARALNFYAVQNLLDMGSAFDITNSDNENVLHLLASNDSSDMTEDDSLYCISLLKKLERRHQHRELIRQLLNQKTISTNETPLFYAVASNRLNLVKFFLRRGTTENVNTQSITGDTPFHIAIKRCNKQMVDLLMRKYVKFFILKNSLHFTFLLYFS